ncbi:diaminopimelate epimerase [Candidatus Woesearchaeota archaeon]|nr:diaminopimelate epimerase [Candidatus Woesearchaeota archaeon]
MQINKSVTTLIEFEKGHTCHNDFLIMDELDRVPMTTVKKKEIAVKYCDRKILGANDILFLEKSSVADVRMRIFEPDGTEAFMCGNGIIYVADYLRRKNGFEKMRIETLAGVREVSLQNGIWVVDMGQLKTKAWEVPIKSERNDIFINKQIKVGFKKFNISIVNSGEPHAVIFLEKNSLYYNDLDKINVELFGRMIRESELFPVGVNVNFVQKINERTIAVRTYERGVEGETYACGTGSVASVGVARLLGLLNSEEVEVVNRGGTHHVEFSDNRLLLKGVPVTLYRGMIEI